MKTYPIYEATFGGSSDFMSHSVLRIAAKDKPSAFIKIRAIQEDRSNMRGSVVRRCQPSGRWLNCLDDGAITKHPKLRSVDPEYREWFSA